RGPGFHKNQVLHRACPGTPRRGALLVGRAPLLRPQESHGLAVGYPVQPSPDTPLPAQRPGLVREEQECALEDVVGRAIVVQQCPADAADHRAVTAHQYFEGAILSLSDEAPDQLLICDRALYLATFAHLTTHLFPARKRSRKNPTLRQGRR